jgi:Rab-GTPase-TBC domain
MSTRHDVAQSEPRLQSGSDPSGPKESLRKSYSMPLSVPETSDIPNGSLTIKASESLPYPTVVRTSKSEDVVAQHQLDRYGFILNMDSHGNVVKNVEQSNHRQLNHNQSSVADDATDSLLNALNQPAPEPISPQSPKLYPERAARTPSEAARTARRVSKWESMLRWPLDATTEHSDASNPEVSWNAFWHRSQRQRRCRTVKRRLRKGIPNQQQRSQVWPILCHVDERMRENPGLYRLLVETSVGVGVAPAMTVATTSPKDTTEPPKLNGSSTQNTAVTDSTDKTRIEINYTEKIGPTQLQSSLKHHPHSHCRKHVIAFQYTKSFKSVQDTIERDLHRTFPRHSLFYTECGEEDSTGNGHSNSWSRHDSLLNDDEQSSDTRDLQQKGICGTTEISSLMRELDLVRSHSDDPVETKSPRATGNADSVANDINSNGGESDIGLAKMLDGAGGQSRLRRVLNAYGTYDREIGYCQGMNFIAAMFLTLVSEEVAFWMLVCKYASYRFLLYLKY